MKFCICLLRQQIRIRLSFLQEPFQLLR
ncbi:hypothetical protein D030_1448A, partial [Vibrio parahaemolyticus AQ3810]